MHDAPTAGAPSAACDFYCLFPRNLDMRRPVFPVLFVTTLCAASLIAADREATIKRVGADIKYLASDELEGRGVETNGIHKAADFILSEYRKYGLKPGMPDGTWKQTFSINLGQSRVNSETKLGITGADGKRKAIDRKAFEPIQRGKNGAAKGELVFIGYGITSESENFDEYADIDVEGKILVLIRREPLQGQDVEAFDGKKVTSHSYIDTKLGLAKKNKAAGIIFVNDPFNSSTPDKDELTQPAGFGANESGLPFVHVRQAIVNSLLEQSPLTVKVGDEEKQLKSLKEVTDHIDSTLRPVSQPMKGLTADITTRFETEAVDAHNLIGVIEGEGELADETIVIGGHYDHLGFGGVGSRARNRTGEIHPGADDNATGTAAVLEVIRRVKAGPPPKRRLVFICFSGEERGLLGSKHYVSNPVFPLEKTIAMLNYDMIGTLRDNNIDVNGVGTAKEFRGIVDAAGEKSPLKLKIVEHPYAGSDHLPFFQQKIPVMFCFTGTTPRYHTPDDKFEAVNVPGVVTVIDFTEQLLRGIDALDEAPEFQQVGRSTTRRPRVPYVGFVPNLNADNDEAGIPVQAVRKGGPAEQAGLKELDVILKVNNKAVANQPDLINVIRTMKAGQEVKLTVKRQDEEVVLTVKLGNPR